MVEPLFASAEVVNVPLGIVTEAVRFVAVVAPLKSYVIVCEPIGSTVFEVTVTVEELPLQTDVAATLKLVTSSTGEVA